MTNKINTLFRDKDKDLLSVYFTAGFPTLDDTATIINALEKNGVDLIEIGMPFSDPLADGPTIQRSSELALENGMSIKVLFGQLKELQTAVPLILMGYLNPVLQYGMENFCRDAATLGVSGVILPDLPLQEYLDEYKAIFDTYNLKNIFLITPQTSEARIRLIDEHSNAFIYVVSTSGTTGKSNEIDSAQENYFKRLQQMKLTNPLIVGFGIHDQRSFSKACEFSNGAIIGSAFIKAIEKSKNLDGDIQTFINNILKNQLTHTVAGAIGININSIS